MSLRRIEAPEAVYYINWETHPFRNLENLFQTVETKEGRKIDALLPEMWPQPHIIEQEVNKELGQTSTDYLGQNNIPLYITDVPANPHFTDVDSGQETRRVIGGGIFASGLAALFAIPITPAWHLLQRKFPDSPLLKERYIFKRKRSQEQTPGEEEQKPLLSRRDVLKLGGTALGLSLLGNAVYPTGLYIGNYFGGDEGSVRSTLRHVGADIHGIWPSWIQEGRSAVRAEQTYRTAKILNKKPELQGRKPILGMYVGADHGNFDTYLLDRQEREAALEHFRPVIEKLSLPYQSTIGEVTWIEGKPIMQRIRSPLIPEEKFKTIYERYWASNNVK
ncbi:MAG: hypothetical protein KC506_03525 [Nanoarchaeota archaeon]|nr:hypothetical protein [Nanoarchaeota archaeon]